MKNPQKKPGWVFWTVAALALLLPVLYVLSIGPACWWMPIRYPMKEVALGGCETHASRIYWPIGWACVKFPDSIGAQVDWYVTRHSSDPIMDIPANPSGTSNFEACRAPRYFYQAR